MRLRDLAQAREADLLSRCAAWTRTEEFRRRLDEARRAIGLWLDETDAPAVSCSGGKDSTLLLLLAREQHPAIPVYRADPPNPLPDRPEHVEALRLAAGGEWRIVPYPWDVESVLAGVARYPAGLKVRRLVAEMAGDQVDGVALGLRAAESRTRRIHVATSGLCYQRKDGLRVCQPLGRWTAEQVVGAVLAADALPLNPVYRRLGAGPGDLERIRDGTWWPVAPDQRGWLAAHYPETLDQYDRAVAAVGGCTWRAEWGEPWGVIHVRPVRVQDPRHKGGTGKSTD